MHTSKTNTTTFGSWNLWAPLAVLSYIILVFLVFAQGNGSKFTLFVVLLAGTLVANRFPTATVGALMVTDVFPTIFQYTPGYSENYGAIGGGLYAVDVVLLCMAGAILLHFLGRIILADSPVLGKVQSVIRQVTNDPVYIDNRNGSVADAAVGHRPIGLSALSVLILLFGLWLFFEIVRNWGVYGLSAPGEFRFRYLILVLPLYIALFFRSEKRRKRLYLLLVYSTLVFTLTCIPLIGMLKGWSVGAENRFVPAHISLGLLYGFTAVVLARKYHYLKTNRIILWVIAMPVLLLVLVDSHRSVWVAAGVGVFVLVYLGEIHLRHFSKRAIVPLVVLLGIVWGAASGLSLNVGQYVITRASELVNPGGARDTTVGWRIAQWNEQLPKFFASPILGEGFGGYWGEVGVFPHNLYLQTLVKTGLVGTLLYAAIIAETLFLFLKWIRAHKTRGHTEMAVALMGFVILIAAHGFYVAYAFEYYTWMFVGLAAAVVRSERNAETRAVIPPFDKGRSLQTEDRDS